MKIRIDRKFVPMLATIVLFILGYAFGYIQYPGMRNPQAFANLFIDKSYLLIAAIGETIVILSGNLLCMIRPIMLPTIMANAFMIDPAAGMASMKSYI